MRKPALFASLAAGLAITLAAFAPSASAQRMASPGATAHFTAPAHPATPAKGPAFNGGRASLAFHESHSLSRFPRSGPFQSQFFPLLANWLSPQDLSTQDLSAQDLYSSGYPVASQLPFAMPGFPAFADSADHQPRPPQESLLIELQGSRYVRVSDGPIEGGVQELTLTPEPNPQSASTPRKHAAQTASHDSAASQAHAIAAASPAAPLPPVVLVLRDGTRQEVRDYTITAGVLYARGDFYTDGYWTRKIDLASLNLPETLTANTTRGVRFVLPSAPNEVVTRP